MIQIVLVMKERSSAMKTNHKCDICSKLLCTKLALQDHKMRHSNEKSHKCDVCLKLFRTRPDLIAHKMTHSNEKNHKCDVCLKLFRTRSNLNGHKMIHSNEKYHKCDVCLKLFCRRSQLISHKMIHSNEKNHKCDVCSKLFYGKQSLQRHQIIHSNEKSHKCDVCLKLFCTRSELIAHKMTHGNEKNHKCDVCLKLFRTRSNLNGHKMIHGNEKNYKCDVCSKLFYRKHVLRRHKIIHEKRSYDIFLGEAQNECIKESIMENDVILNTDDNIVFDMIAVSPAITVNETALIEVKMEPTKLSFELKPLNVSIIRNEEDEISHMNSYVAGSAIDDMKQENQIIKSENLDEFFCETAPIEVKVEPTKLSFELKPLNVSIIHNEEDEISHINSYVAGSAIDDMKQENQIIKSENLDEFFCETAPIEMKVEPTKLSFELKPLNVSIIHNEEDEISHMNSYVAGSAIDDMKQENQIIKSENLDEFFCENDMESVFYNNVDKMSECVNDVKLEINDSINFKNDLVN